MRLALIIGLIVTLAAGAQHHAAHGEQRQSIRIGYALSLTGHNADGARTTVLPNYRMWVADVNRAGGIMLSRLGRRLPIEVIEYDDASSAAGAMRSVQRLINEDKVDFILSPWGTGLNFAVAPLLNAAGYPQIVATAVPDREDDLVQRWPNCFWLLGTSSDHVQGLVQVLSQLYAQGKIGNRIALIGVADRFGIDLQRAARTAFRRAKFDLVYDRTYPVGTEDMRPLLAQIRQTGADALIAFSYPPDTTLLIEQSVAMKYNPKVFYTAIGTAYPRLRDHFGANAEGIMGIGGWDADAAPSQHYLSQHVLQMGQEPDRWASPVNYAGLQMLQQAIEHVGAVDREAVIQELRTGTFETVVGTVRLENNFRRGVFEVGQWQNGEFHGIAPNLLPGARAVEFPKPDWSIAPDAPTQPVVKVAE